MTKNRHTISEDLYIIGIILATISFLACIASFYLLIFGLPVFISGAILILASKKETRTKLLSIGIPLILYVPCAYLFLTAYNYSPPKTFMIPEHHEGPLRIVYEETCGRRPLKQNGRLVLKFPESGILILSSDFDGDLDNIECYLIGPDRRKRHIPFLTDLKDSDTHATCVLGGPAGKLDYPNGIVFSDFHLQRPHTAHSDAQVLEKFDDMTKDMVYNCRNQTKGVKPALLDPGMILINFKPWMQTE